MSFLSVSLASKRCRRTRVVSSSMCISSCFLFFGRKLRSSRGQISRPITGICGHSFAPGATPEHSRTQQRRTEQSSAEQSTAEQKQRNALGDNSSKQMSSNTGLAASLPFGVGLGRRSVKQDTKVTDLGTHRFDLSALHLEATERTIQQHTGGPACSGGTPP